MNTKVHGFMTLDARFGIVVLVAIIFWFLWFCANRKSGPPEHPMRVHRCVATLAGFRATWVDCKPLALQVGTSSAPFLYALLVWNFDLYSFPSTMALTLVVALTLQFVFRSYAKWRLRDAEYLILGFRVLLYAKGNIPSNYELICQHCGYQEHSCNYAMINIGALPEVHHLGLLLPSNSGPLAPVVSRRIADILRASETTGLVLIPVGGHEPAEWYGLRSNNILPPMQGDSKGQSPLPYRTQQCECNHGIEPLPRILRSDIIYNRSTFHALDINYSFELSGNGTRRGTRSIVISQRVYRLLAQIDKTMQWSCQPLRFNS